MISSFNRSKVTNLKIEFEKLKIGKEAMLKSVNEGWLAGVASDCGGILVGDTDDPLYQKLLKLPKVLVTPHVSYNTPMSMKLGADVMIDNVEAWIKGKPQNVVTWYDNRFYLLL